MRSGGRSSADDRSRHLIVPLFIPHMGCPHQCVFCNQRAITGAAAVIPTVDEIRRTVRQYLTYGRKAPDQVQISFFGGSFLGLPLETVKALLCTATAFVQRGEVDGLRFSTRPDTVTAEILDAIRSYPVATVELGVQSMNDTVLAAARRGHTAADTVAAATLLKARGYQLGLQLMVGLPGDDELSLMDSARRVADLKPDFVRIYPTLVLAGSPLARQFRSGDYRPLSLDRCVTLVKRMFLLFHERGIPVVRMGLQASDGLHDDHRLLAGPYHPAFGHLVHGEIARDAVCAVLDRLAPTPKQLAIAVHPAMVSRVQGLSRRNLSFLRLRYGLEAIAIRQDETLARNRLLIQEQPVTLP